MKPFGIYLNRFSRILLIFFLCACSKGFETGNLTPRIPDLAGSPGSSGSPGAVIPNTRSTVISNYKNIYRSGIPDMQWTGDVASCKAGTTSIAYQQRVIDQINYYRNLAGLSSVTLTPNSSGNQEAALMMSANGQLNHSPPSTWKCYTSSGSGAAGSSNLALGTEGTGAIDLYMDDWGSANFAVGHRRWVLNPSTGTFSTGDVPGANSLAVWLGGNGGSMPASGFVAWPSAGYFPVQNLPAGSNRWSFSTVDGGFGTDTTVTMRNVTENIDYPTVKEDVWYGYGNPTLVWVPQNFNPNTAYQKDVEIRVTISNVNTGSGMKSYSYSVILVNGDQ